jgi:paraquat-inducible protein B
VSIGTVSDIALAGDKRHVEVTFALGVKVLHALGLAVEELEGKKTKLVIPDDLRAQLASTGITGVKFIQMDFFDVASNPPPTLPFEVTENHIPAVASMMKSLENSVVQAVDRFPELAQQLVLVFTQLNSIFADVQNGDLLKKLAEAVVLVNQVLAQVSTSLGALDVPRLSGEVHQALKNVNLVLLNVNEVVNRIGGDKGLAASLQTASDAVGGVARNANHVGPAIEEALRDVQGAAQSVQRLADALEVDPDMLLKGRAKRVHP